MQDVAACFFEVYVSVSQYIHVVSLVYEFELIKQGSFCICVFSVAC